MKERPSVLAFTASECAVNILWVLLFVVYRLQRMQGGISQRPLHVCVFYGCLSLALLFCLECHKPRGWSNQGKKGHDRLVVFSVCLDFKAGQQRGYKHLGSLGSLFWLLVLAGGW